MAYYKATQRIIRAEGRRERGDVWRASLAETDRGLVSGHIEILKIPEGVIIIEEVQDVGTFGSYEGA